jgi:membrane protease subunit HflK
VTETTHTRSRRASLGGLVVQVVMFIAILVLAQITNSAAAFNLSWFVLGGVAIWFVSFLVFRQHELAALEQMDLEALRRERQATGGGEALFDAEGGGGLEFQLAQRRLVWMQRWLVPIFSLLTAIYLVVMGLSAWFSMSDQGKMIGGEDWGPLFQMPLALVILGVLLLGGFLLSRYTSGMGRVKEWQLLRGCGSYLLANVMGIMGLMICFGVVQYAQIMTWEQTLAYIIPVVMVILGVEMGVNFVLDVYRPRTAGVEARAAFDSRLLGLFAEPGGIAHSIAEALNYQFGFQVSQTWFYRLLEWTAVPMLLAGVLALWALTTIVVVQPYEHVIVERFGRQLNPGGTAADGTERPAPWEPGLHFKLPWPIDLARAYNTGELHQFHVGWYDFDAVPEHTEDASTTVLLWTDDQHLGLRHFDFLVSPPADAAEADERNDRFQFGEEAEAAPVHMMRMEVRVQYRIDHTQLHRYSQLVENPRKMIRDIAWEEVTRFNAALTADDLLGDRLDELGDILGERITERVRLLGLEVVYVGVTNVHPEKTVAQAYREVIKAEQAMVAAIRAARVAEDTRLSKVAGSANFARSLALATDRGVKATSRINNTKQDLSDADSSAVGAYQGRLLDQADRFEALVRAEAALEDARARAQRAEQDYELGMGQTLESRQAARDDVVAAEQDLQDAELSLERLLREMRTEAARQMDPETFATLVEYVKAVVAEEYWNAYLSEAFTQSQLGGEAAAEIATAMAERWEIELEPAGLLNQARLELAAYQAAPELFKTRQLLDVMVAGLREARKYFLAFTPGPDQKVRIRLITTDELGTDPTTWADPSEEN